MLESTRPRLINAVFSCLAALMACHASIAQAAQTAPTSANSVESQGTEPDIVFGMSNDNAMPLAEFRDYQPTQGILKDLGDAIAAAMHRKAKYIVVPRKRLDAALQHGVVDGVCYIRPEWVGTALNWSAPVIPNDILLVSSSDMPKPKRLEDVAGKTIGLVLGYKYPELDAIRDNYQREDAPNMPLNISKLLAGHVQYAVVDQMTLDYQQKLHPELARFARLPITKISASCGFSPASKIPIDEINRAIQQLAGKNAIEEILARYR